MKFRYQLPISSGYFNLGEYDSYEEAENRLKQILNLPELKEDILLYEYKEEDIDKKIDELRSKFINQGKIKDLFREAIEFGRSLKEQ